MDIFEKCRRRGLVHEVREKGVYPYFYALKERGVKIIESETPVVPIYTYEAFNTLEKTRKAYDAGVYVNPVLPPACAPNECLMRTSLMATHTYPLLDEAADILAAVMNDEN